MTHPEATELLSHLLGEHYNLSTGFAKIVKPGAVAETLHTDQWWYPPPQIRQRGPGAEEAQPEVRAGSITRELAYTPAMHSGDNLVTPVAGEGAGTSENTSAVPPQHVISRDASDRLLRFQRACSLFRRAARTRRCSCARTLTRRTVRRYWFRAATWPAATRPNTRRRR